MKLHLIPMILYSIKISITYGDFNYFFDKYITNKYTTQYHSPPQAPLGLRFCIGGLGGRAPQQILYIFL